METDKDILRSYGEFSHEDYGIHYCYLIDSRRGIIVGVGGNKEESITSIMKNVKNKVLMECEWLDNIKNGCV